MNDTNFTPSFAAKPGLASEPGLASATAASDRPSSQPVSPPADTAGDAAPAAPSEPSHPSEADTRDPPTDPSEAGMRSLDTLRAHAPAAYDHLTAVWPADAARNLHAAIGYATELFAADPALSRAFGDPALGDNGRLIEAAHHAALGRRLLTADDPHAVLAEIRPSFARRAPEGGPSEGRQTKGDMSAEARRAKEDAKLARVEELMRRPDYWSENVQAEVQRLYRDVYGDGPLIGRDGRTI